MRFHCDLVNYSWRACLGEVGEGLDFAHFICAERQVFNFLRTWFDF